MTAMGVENGNVAVGAKFWTNAWHDIYTYEAITTFSGTAPVGGIFLTFGDLESETGRRWHGMLTYDHVPVICQKPLLEGK